MTNLRGWVHWYDMDIAVTPKSKGQPFYLTGDSPEFELAVKNPSKRRRSGTLVVTWQMVGAMMTVRPIIIDVPAGKSRRYPIPAEWLAIPGTAIYELVILPTEPEDTNANVSHLGEPRAYNMHTLCSYSVQDRGVYQSQKSRHEEMLRAIRGKSK